MKRNEVKSKNYVNNEKRLKEDKIWDEFNESEYKRSVYEEIHEDRDFYDIKLSRNSNKPQSKKFFNEDDYKNVQTSKSIPE